MTRSRLFTDQRRVLEILAGDQYGATEDFLVLAHGFERGMIAGLVREGLVTAHGEPTRAGGKTVGVIRIQITAAGRKAIEG
jgi:hypothetical protein